MVTAEHLRRLIANSQNTIDGLRRMRQGCIGFPDDLEKCDALIQINEQRIADWEEQIRAMGRTP